MSAYVKEQLKIESGEPVVRSADVAKKRPRNSTPPEAKAWFLDFADAMARGRAWTTAQSLQQTKGMAPELTTSANGGLEMQALAAAGPTLC